MPKERIIDVDEILETQDLNQHTEYGLKMIEDSINENGFGRSLLLDKNGKVVAGRAVLIAMKKAGIKKVKVVETDGNTLVAHKRIDIDIDSEKGKSLALADNRTTELNLNYNLEEISMSIGEEGLDNLGLTDVITFFKNTKKRLQKTSKDKDKDSNFNNQPTPKDKHDAFVNAENRQISLPYTSTEHAELKLKTEQLSIKLGHKNISETFYKLIMQYVKN